SAREEPASHEAPQERDDFLPTFRRFHVRDVVAQELPPLRMALPGVDLLQFTIDDVETLHRRQIVLESGESEMRAWRDERIDLCGGEMIKEIRDEVVETVE